MHVEDVDAKRNCMWGSNNVDARDNKSQEPSIGRYQGHETYIVMLN
jgi:hypothetical protein